jgi:DNA (cytosine-5)-methyltransferase 1
MKYISICSGIEAASTAWHSLGWEPLAFSEIEPFPCAVLAHHWPHVPNLGDMTKHYDWPNDIRPDLIVGGTPCQAFSVAGLREGLADPRGNLTLTFLSIVAQYRPEWVVWENVPGVLSDKTGAFGAFLGGLGELGYGFAYRVLDAQFLGVAQRRRRVFVVANLTDWRRAAAVLFEQHSLSGDSPPSRSARKGAATGFEDGVIGSLCARDFKGVGNQFVDEGKVIPVCMATGQGNAEIATEMCPTLNCNHEAPIITTQYGEIAGTLTARHDSSPCADQGQNVVAFSCKDHTNGGGQVAVAFSEGYFRCGSGHAPNEELANTLQCNTGDQRISIATNYAVRRLTPTECERLQGFPDGHTAIPYRGKPAADGPRYKACGNSMAVPVMRWIGERIEKISELMKEISIDT